MALSATLLDRMETFLRETEPAPSIDEALTERIGKFLEETGEWKPEGPLHQEYAAQRIPPVRGPAGPLPEHMEKGLERREPAFEELRNTFDQAQAILQPNPQQATQAAAFFAKNVTAENRDELLHTVQALAAQRGQGGLASRLGTTLAESTVQVGERLKQFVREDLSEEQRDFAQDLLMAVRKGAPLHYGKEDLGQPWRWIANSMIGGAEAMPPMTAGILVATMARAAAAPVAAAAGTAVGGPPGGAAAGLAASRVAGPIANAAFWYTQIYPDEIREMREAGLPPDQAKLAARISASLQAAIESLMVNPLTPKKLVAEPVRRGLRAFAKRAVIQYAKQLGKEWAEEPLQAIGGEGVKAVMTRLNEEVPDTDVMELIRKPYEATRDSFGPLLALTLPGGVYGGVREFREYGATEKVRSYLLDEDGKGAVALAMADPERAAGIAQKAAKGEDISRADVGNLSQVLTKAEDRKEFGRIVADAMVKAQQAIQPAQEQPLTGVPAKAAPAVGPEMVAEKPAEAAEPTKPPTTLEEFAKVQGYEELPKKGTKSRKELSQQWRQQIASEQETSLDEVNLTRKVLDEWWATKDVEEMHARSDALRHQQDVVKAADTKKYNDQAKQLDQLIQLNIDLRGKATEEIAKYYEDLTPEQQKMVDDSQKLSPEALAIADQIIEENTRIGLEAMGEEVIRNVIDNYTMRLWKKTPAGRETRATRKFAPTTERARQRTLSSMLEGWARGKELRIKSATNAQNVMRNQIYQAVADKQLLDLASQLGLISPRQPEGWVAIEHPNFKRWIPVGKAEEGKVYGRDMFIGKEGTIFQRVPMYAEPKLGKTLNKVLGVSGLYKIPGMETVTKWNAIIKATILTTSLYHHQAFLRSYLLAGRGWNVVQGWREGRKALLNFTPELELLAKNGLTVGRRQDFEERYLQEKTRIGELIDKVPGAKQVKDTLIQWRDQQLDFLFSRMGPYLKIHYALLEYAHLVQKHRTGLDKGDMTHDDLAKIAANIANDDFGGLHLGRMKRSPTVQHGMRLLLLAPDWTESNVRSMAKAITAGSLAERQAYRALWGRVALRGGLATITFNFLMSMLATGLFGDDEEDFLDRYRRAWKEGHLRWLDIDITPIYRALGYEDKKHKYFSLIGHFRDPIKFVTNFKPSVKHKGSVLTRIFADWYTGSDYADRSFTSLSELLGVDDKGVYKSSRPGFYQAGEPKGGKLKGQLVTRARYQGKRQGLARVPSWLLYEARQSVPIQVQNAIAFMAGEADAFDSISKGLGLMTATTYPKQKQEPELTPEFIESQIVAATTIPPESLKQRSREKREAFAARQERRRAEIKKAEGYLGQVDISDREVYRFLQRKYKDSDTIRKRFGQWRRFRR